MTTHGKSSTIRTDWFAGPLDRDFADRLVEAITKLDPPKCGRGSGDRSEGAFVTRHYGNLTVGFRGCDRYQARVHLAFDYTAKMAVFTAAVKSGTEGTN